MLNNLTKTIVTLTVLAVCAFPAPAQNPAPEKQVLVGGDGENLPPCPRFDLSFQSAMMFKGSAYSVEIVKREEGIRHIGKGGPKPKDELVVAYVISPEQPDLRFSQTCEIHVEIKHVFKPVEEQ